MTLRFLGYDKTPASYHRNFFPLPQGVSAEMGCKMKLVWVAPYGACCFCLFCRYKAVAPMGQIGESGSGDFKTPP